MNIEQTKEALAEIYGYELTANTGLPNTYKEGTAEYEAFEVGKRNFWLDFDVLR